MSTDSSAASASTVEAKTEGKSETKTDAIWRPVPVTSGSGDACKECTWYYAIGSMMNPTSLALRNIHPSESYPAVLEGWELVFKGGGGMASIDQKEGASMHGVLHKVTADEKKALDQIEAGYNHVEVTVTKYDGTSEKAVAYQMKPELLDPRVPHALPSERYLDIIGRGMIHYGVKKEFYDWLKKQPCVPRRSPKEFQAFALPENARKVSHAELASMTGDGDKELWFSVNNKVLKWVGDLKQPGAAQSYAFGKGRFAGRDITFGYATMLYEPLYPVPKSPEDLSAEHRAYIEDVWVVTVKSKDPPFWQCIGSLDSKA